MAVDRGLIGGVDDQVYAFEALTGEIPVDYIAQPEPFGL